jgi:hypothetical protein
MPVMALALRFRYTKSLSDSGQVCVAATHAALGDVHGFGVCSGKRSDAALSSVDRLLLLWVCS